MVDLQNETYWKIDTLLEGFLKALTKYITSFNSSQYMRGRRDRDTILSL